MTAHSETPDSQAASASRFRFTTASMLLAISAASLVLAGYSRGNYLFGQGGGILYAIVGSLIVLLYYRALSRTPVPKVRVIALTLLAIPTSLAFTFPTYLNPVLQYGIDDHRIDRMARAELSKVFAEDPAFGNLSVSTKHLKIVNVEIRGTVPTDNDLDRLRTRVMEHCEFPKHCFIHWRVNVRSGRSP